MTEVEKMRSTQLADMAAPELQVRFEHAKKLLARMRGMSTYDAGYRELLEELVPEIPETSIICPPFHCDHGDGIKLGEHVFVNANCTFLDGGYITIGAHTLVGPCVQIYTPHHPMDYLERRGSKEYAYPVTIGEDCWIGGPAGEIISLIGEIGTFALTAMSGVEMAADTSANAISTVEKASVILAVISAVIQVATKIFNMFTKDDTTEKYEKAKETYESYINILDRVIEKQLELAETLTGDTANAVYEAAIANIKLQSENAKVLGRQYLNSGASGKSHSKGYDEVDDMSGEGWKQAAKALGMSVDEFKKKMGGRMTGLFDLTDEQLVKLQSDAGIFWSQLDSDTQKFADKIANGVGQVAEVLEQQIADTTLIDYASLRSDFQDLLTDMDADSADFADNFEEYMKNAIVNSMLKEEFMDSLMAWREKLNNAMDDGMTEDEYNALKAEGQQLSNEMKAKRDAMAEMFGWNDNDDEREASKKGFASMSQDSANKLDGSFAVVTSHTYSINEEVKSINSGTEKIAEKLSYLINMDKNMAEMLRCNDTIVSYLSDISNYTSNLVEIREFMYAVKLGIDTLNTKGITLKR